MTDPPDLRVGDLVWARSDTKKGFIVAVIVGLTPVMGIMSHMKRPVSVSYVDCVLFHATWCRTWICGRAVATFGGPQWL